MDNQRGFLVENLSAGYEKQEIVHQVSFFAEPGTLTCLLGPNGCGKTTLMKSLAGLLSHEGFCQLNGQNIETMTLKQRSQRISYIPQRSGISISLPVLDVVLMGFNPVLKLLDHPSKEQVEKARQALVSVGLAGAEEQDYLTLSEGQKQLVILARMLIENTDLLLMDEPDSALDFQNRHRMIQRIRDMVRDEKKTGILCLHDPMLALAYCDQIVLMKDGKPEDVLYPAKDTVEKMTAAFSKIYGSVSVASLTDRYGKEHLTLIWEDEQ